MTTLYKLLFRLLQWHATLIDRAMFVLYMRLVNEYEAIESETSEQLAPPPDTNVVHIPRRGLH